MSVLYLSLDGVLDPIGTSQVARPVIALAERGIPYTLVTLEKDKARKNMGRVHELRQDLSAAGVSWVSLPYAEGGGARQISANMLRLSRAAHRASSMQRFHFVHARSYVAGAVAMGIKLTTGTPYLFDTRGYWIDEQAEVGRWIEGGRVYRSAKGFERRLFKHANAIVTLTELAADDLKRGAFGPVVSQDLIRAIPTCADYENYSTAKTRSRLPGEIQHRLGAGPVFGYIGSINPSYYARESLELFLRVYRRNPSAHLLCLCGQQELMRGLAESVELPPTSYTIQSVPHAEVGRWLSAIDWGFLLLKHVYAKRASMPTKLAEFFAAGVRPIQFGCNEEVAEWVQKAGSGMVVNSMDDGGLTRAADRILELTTEADPQICERARRETSGHFSLTAGTDAYEELTMKLLAGLKP